MNMPHWHLGTTHFPTFLHKIMQIIVIELDAHVIVYSLVLCSTLLNHPLFSHSVKERKQFGANLGAFQITQEKLARMLANIQGMTLVAWRLSKLYEEGKMTHSMASNVKVCERIITTATESLTLC